jgi:gliding motility-associated-like protein
MRNSRIVYILAFILCICVYVDWSVAGYNSVRSVNMTARVEVISNIIPPVVYIPKHTPLDRYNIVNDQIVMNVTLATQSGYTNCSLYYRIQGATNYILMNFTPLIAAAVTNYRGEAIIPSADVTVAGVEYYITAKGPTNIWSFRSNISPQVIPFVAQESLVYTRNGNHTLTLKDGNTYDGTTSLTIDNYAENGNILFKELINKGSDYPKNSFPNVQNTTPAMLFEIQPLGRVLPDSAKLNLLYLDINKDGSEDTLGSDERLLKIFWFDGWEWRYVGGNADIDANIIQSTIYRFGTFGIFPISRVDQSSFKPSDKIITPNEDGINDTLLFSGLTGQYEIKIVDMTGRLVKVITDVPYWDGLNMNGKEAPGGVYVYMLKQNGKILKGTFVIAR